VIKATYIKTAQKIYTNYSSYLMLHIDYHKSFKAMGQAELDVSKITDGKSISSINRKPYKKYQITGFIFFLASF
jgi:hypothetical protein